MTGVTYSVTYVVCLNKNIHPSEPVLKVVVFMETGA